MSTSADTSTSSPLTAAFHDVPSEHDGSNAFSIGLRFSEDFGGRLPYTMLRDQALQATNGRVTRARRAAQNQNQLWIITVRPQSEADVTVSLATSSDCSAAVSICTPDGRSLSNSPSVTVSGPSENEDRDDEPPPKSTPPANTPPAITASGNKTYEQGETIAPFGITVADADGDTVAVDVTGLPSGLSYTNGQVQGTVAADAAAQDYTATISANDGVNAAVTATFTITVTPERIRPTVTISGPSDTQNGAFGVTITFSESVTGFVQGDLTVDNGAVTAFSGSEASYTATITPSATGAVTVDVAANVAEDTANNGNTAANRYSVQATVPSNEVPEAPETPAASLPLTAAFLDVPSEHDGSNTFSFGLRFSEDFGGRLRYTMLRDQALQATNGTVTRARRAAQNQNQSWIITVQPNSEADVTVSLATSLDCSAAVSICTPDGRSLSNSPSVTVSGPPQNKEPEDEPPPENTPPANTPPAITAPGDKTYEQGETITAFGIAVTDADGDTVTVDVTGLPSGLSYTDGQVQGTVTADAATQAYTATISANDGVNTAVTATFTITVTVPAPPPVPSPPTISSVTITSTPSFDADGNGTVETYLWRESIEVTVTYSADVVWNVSAPGAQLRLRLDVEGSENTTKLARLVTGGATSGTARSLVFGYTVGRRDRDTDGVYPKPSGTGNIVHLISGATLKDSHGQNVSRTHGGLSANPNHQVDGSENLAVPAAPALTVADASAAEGDSITFTVTLDQAVSGGLTVIPSFTDGTAAKGTDYTENTAALSFAGSANETQSFTVATLEDAIVEADETFTVSLTVSETTAAVTATDTATGTITDDDNAANAPPVITDPGDKTYQPGQTIRPFAIRAGDADQDALTVTVTGLPPGLSYTGGKVQGTVAADARLQSYAVAVTADDGVNAAVTETFTITVRARRARSTNDLTRPTAAISGPTASQSDSFNVTITFSEPVTGFDKADVTVGNGSVTAFSGSGTSYTSTITPTASGTVTVDVAANVASDGGGNGNTAASQFTVKAALTRPTVVISGPTNVQTGAFTVDIDFSEFVTGFDKTDVTVGNGRVTGWAETGGSALVIIKPAATGTVTVDVPANVAVDSNNNGNLAATRYSVEANVGEPTVTISCPAGVQTGAFTVDIDFSEFVTGFEQSDVTVGNGRVTGWAETGGSTLAIITPAATGTVTVDVPANVAVDSQGYGNFAAQQCSVQAQIVPRVTIADASANEGDSITFTVTLDRAVSGGLRVTPSFSDGTATKGTDYTQNTAPLSFAGTAGEKKTFTVATTEDQAVEANETFTVGLTVSGTTATVTATDTATGTIKNDDERQCSTCWWTISVGGGGTPLTAQTLEVEEGATVDLTLTQKVDGQRTLKYWTSSDTDHNGSADPATAFVDYRGFFRNISVATVTFSGKGDTKTIRLPTYEDTLVERDEFYRLYIESNYENTGYLDNRLIYIRNDDQATITVSDSTITEGGTMAFTATLDKQLAHSATVTPSFTSGTATGNGNDYFEDSQPITFAGTAGEKKTFTTRTKHDSVTEETETFTAGLTVARSLPYWHYTGEGDAIAVVAGTATIVDDDTPTLTVADALAIEGDSLTFTVTLDNAVPGGLTVTPSFTDITATKGTDYTANTAALKFAGTRGETKTFTVATAEDTEFEVDETFTVGLGISGTSHAVDTSTATGTIIDEDRPPAVTIDDSSVGEGGVMTFTVTLDKAVSGGLTITPSFTDVTATKGTDYTANTAALTFTGTRGETRTFQVPLIEDTEPELKETFTVSLTVSGTTETVTATDTATGNILDNDTGVIGAAVTIADASADEGEALTFTVTLNDSVSGGFQVIPSFSGGTATKGTDYTANTAALTFTGNLGEQHTFTVSTTGDEVVEANETFTVGLTVSGTTETVTATDTATGTILDDDGPKSVTITDASASEGDSLTFTVALNRAVPGGFQVTPSFTDGTATSGTDYTENTAALTFSGNAGEHHTFTVSSTEDTVVEADETFTVSLAVAGTTESVAATDTATGTIIDDDGATGVTVADARAGEGDSLTFTVTLNKSVSGGFTVTPGFTDVTATGGTDYTRNTAALTFSGNAGEQHTFTVPTTADEVVELDETFTVSLAVSGTTATVAATDTATGAIANDDTATVTVSDVSGAEGGPGFSFVVDGNLYTEVALTATLDKAVQGGFQLYLYASSGTATKDPDATNFSTTDFGANPVSLWFAGNAGEQQSLDKNWVAIHQDEVVEETETFRISYSLGPLPGEGPVLPPVPDGVTVDGPATGTIIDDDAGTVTITDASAAEGNAITFTTTLDKAVVGGFSVTPSFTDGTAVKGTDYTENTTALSFAGTAGERQTFTVATTADTNNEQIETFTVDLIVSGTSLPVTAPDSATGMIIDANASPAVTVADASAQEGGSMTFRVTLHKAVSGGLTVTPGFTDVSAVKGTDYTENTAALSFAGTAGEQQTFTVSTTEDEVAEADETFTVGLTVSGTTATVTATDTATGKILDDDAGASNAPPTIAPPGDKTYEQGAAIDPFGITVADADADRVTVTVTGLPSGLSYTSGQVQGTVATNAAARAHTVTISADDGVNAAVTRTFTITVTAVGPYRIEGPAGPLKTYDPFEVRVHGGSPSRGYYFYYEDSTFKRIAHRHLRIWPGRKGRDQKSTAPFVVFLRAAPQGVTSQGRHSPLKGEYGVVVDPDPPNVSISGPTQLQKGPFEVTFTVSEENVHYRSGVKASGVDGGFHKDRIVVTNGSVTSFRGDWRTYVAQITPTESGAVVVEVPAGVLRDHVGWVNQAARHEVQVDIDSPGVTIGGVPATVSTKDPLTVTFEFTESVTGFETSDIAVQHGTLGALTDSGTTRSAQVTPNGGGDLTVKVASGAALDAAGNAGPGTAVSATAQWTGTPPEESNAPPVITAPADRTYVQGETITPFGIAVANEPDDTLTVTVTGLPSGLSYSSDQVRGTVAGDAAAQAYTVTISADDGVNDAVTATFTVTVTANASPVITAPGNKTYEQGETITPFGITVTDADGDPVTVTVTGLPPELSYALGQVKGTVDASATARTYTATITAVDGVNDPVTETFSIAVVVPGASNALPAITAPANTTYEQGETITPFGIAVRDADGDPVTVTVTGLPSGLSYTSDQVRGTVAADALTQAYTVSITANDGVNEAEAAAFFKITVTPKSGAAPTPTVTVADASAAEGDTMTFTVTLDKSVSGGFTVTPDFTDGTATEGADYTENTAALSFAGTAGETQSFTVATMQDTEDETDETFTVSLSVSGATVTATDTATGTITNAAVAPAVMIADASASEGDSLAFTVTLDKAVSGGFTVTPNFTDGTAAKGTDYTANAAALSFAGTAGETQSFTVATTQDTEDETDETFTVSLSVSGATVTATDTATGTIIDDDAAPAVTIADASAGEGDSMTFTVTLDKAVSGGFTVTPSFTDGTASKGTDYTENTAALSFAGTAGETQTFTVATAEDTDDEHETFTVGLSVSGTSATVTATDTATGTIIDGGSAAVLIDNARAQEGNRITFAVVLTKAVAGGLTVTPSFTDGTATEGVDYTKNGAAITFAGTKDEVQVFTVATTEDDAAEQDETFTVGLAVSGTSTAVTTTTATGTILDDDSAPAVTIIDASADEGDQLAFTVTLDKPVWLGFKVTPSFIDGTTTKGTDYKENTQAVTFVGTRGEKQTITVATTEDSDVENDETFTVSLAVSGTSETVTATHMATGTILNDDAPAVTIADASASEGDSITFTVTLDKAVSGGFTVTPTFTDGTATKATDYTENTAGIGFAGTAGESRTFTVSTAEDDLVEAGETFTVGLSVSGTPTAVTATDTATGTIDDDDTATVTINDASASEGDAIAFTVTLDNEVSGGFTVTPTFTDGTAEKGTDYTENVETLSFAGTAGQAQTFFVATTEDTDREADETFTVDLTVSGTTAAVTAAATATGTINDDDGTPNAPSEVTAAIVTIADASAIEGDSMTFTVTLDKAISGGLTVTPSFADGTATEGTDYTENTEALSFAGTAGETQTFTVATTEDADEEPDETFTVSLAVSGTQASVTAIDTATGTITDDPPPVFNEGETVVRSVAENTPPGTAIGEPIIATDAEDDPLAYTLGGADASAFTLDPVTGQLKTKESLDFEARSTYDSLTVTADDGHGHTDTLSLTVNVTDVPPPDAPDAPTVTRSRSDPTSALDVGWTAPADNGAPITDYDVRYRETGTTAWREHAFEGTGTGATITSLTKTSTYEVQVRARSGEGASEWSDSGRGATLYLSVTIANARAAEGDPLSFTVTLNRAVQDGLTVTPRFADGTADEGIDYTASTAALKFAGTAGETQTFTVATVQDEVVEADETFTVSLGVSNASSWVVVGDPATGTIADDDGTVSGNATVTIADARATEGDPLTFTVTLKRAVQGGLTVTPGFADGTAAEGADYTANTAALTFTGTAGETQTFTVATVQDEIVEADETFTVGLNVSNAPSGAMAGAPATGTIADDDGTVSGNATVTIADARATEGDPLTFTVTLNRAVQGGLTVTPDFADGTAAEGIDYTANAAALMFTGTAGETQTFTVATVQDEVVEADESFTVGLNVSNAPSGATAGDPATVTIADEDKATVTVVDADAAEGDSLTFTVTLNRAVQDGLTVTPGFADGTAAAGADYTANTAALTFTGNAGETQTFTVATVQDEVVEADETFTVSLNVSDAPSGATAGDPATGTIADDDGGTAGGDATVTIAEVSTAEAGAAEASAVEGDPLTFTVTLNRPVQGGLTVTPGFTDGTAAEGADYTANTAALTFTGNAGETQTFTVTTIDDAVVEEDETFTVSLNVSDAPSGATAGNPATGTIADDDGGTAGGSATVTIAEAGAAEAGAAEASAVEGNPLTFTVTLNRAVQGGLTVTPSFTDGTATEGADYTANTTALTFTGTAGETQTLTVATIEDAVVEEDETFTVSLGLSNAPSGATAGDPATGTIADDDGGTAGGSATVTIADASAAEGDPLTFTVTLNRAVQGGLTVTPGFADGTAAEDADYTATTAPLTFTGNAGETRTFTVATAQDTVVEDDETFTVSLDVSNAPSGVAAGDPATGTIADDDAAESGRLKTIHESILTDVSSLMADGVALALSARVEQMSSQCVTRELELTGLQAAANSRAREMYRPDESETTLRDLLGGSSFVTTPFGCDQGRDLTLWGRADLRKLSGRDPGSAVGWEGELFGQFLGADLNLGTRAAVGAAIARFESEFDYEHFRNGENSPGMYKAHMTSVHPYVAWSASAGLELWASVGYGTGEVRFNEEDFGAQRADSRWRTAAVGGTYRLDTRGDLLPGGRTTLDLRTEAWANRQQVDDNGELVRSLDVDTQRLRATFVGKYFRELDSGAQLIPSLELGARGGGGHNGAGVETAAGLQYTEPGGRFSFDARVHTVVAQRQPGTEWGLSGSIRLSPRRDGRGLSFNVTPAYGAETQGSAQLWNQQMLRVHAPATGRGTRVQAALGYGLSALRGLLTLQSGADRYDNGGSRYTVGGDFKAGRLNLKLELERRESRTDDPSHGLMLRGNMRF